MTKSGIVTSALEQHRPMTKGKTTSHRQQLAFGGLVKIQKKMPFSIPPSVFLFIKNFGWLTHLVKLVPEFTYLASKSISNHGVQSLSIRSGA